MRMMFAYSRTAGAWIYQARPLMFRSAIIFGSLLLYLVVLGMLGVLLRCPEVELAFCVFVSETISCLRR